MRLITRFVLAAIILAIPAINATAQQSQPCKTTKVGVYNAPDLSKRQSTENIPFEVYAADTTLGNGWFSAQVSSRVTRKFFLMSERCAMKFHTGNAPSEWRSTQQHIPVRKDEPAPTQQIVDRIVTVHDTVTNRLVYHDTTTVIKREYLEQEPARKERSWVSKNWWIPVLASAAAGTAIAVLGRSKNTNTNTICNSNVLGVCPAR